MPREIGRKPRMIYPQIATSLSIASVSALAELLFWRILPQADDQGRLSGDPLQLKATTCPIREELTTEKIPKLLEELEKAKLIIRYSNSSTDCIQITRWWDYQGAMRRIFPSQYPPPAGWQDRVKDVSAGQTPTIADTRPDVETPLSPPLNNPPLTPQEPEREKEEEEAPTTAATEKVIEPEKEEEAGKKAKEPSATPVAETATKLSFLETHEGSERATVTATELLRFVETLEGWRFEKSDDLAWLIEFCRDWTDFNLKLAKECRDWHSGKTRARHKGVWKNRFRHWIERERQHEGKEKYSAEKKEKPIEGLRMERLDDHRS